MSNYIDRRHFIRGTATGVAGSLLARLPSGAQAATNAQLRLTPGGFARGDFENFVHMRYGTGQPVYWYGVGDASTFPDGKMFMRTEGYDIGRLWRLDTEKSEAVGLTRKLIVMRDPVSGEILKTPDGKPVWRDNFTYQLFNMRLENGFIVFDVESGAGRFRGTTHGGLGRSEVQHLPGMTIYATPVNYSLPDVTGAGGDLKVWEHYDFIEYETPGGAKYSATWAGAFPLPPPMGPGRSSMHGFFQRYDNYADVPATLREFVEEYAPLWKAPPVDMDEIRSLQE